MRDLAAEDAGIWLAAHPASSQEHKYAFEATRTFIVSSAII
jgi:hypothetical protein